MSWFTAAAAGFMGGAVHGLTSSSYGSQNGRGYSENTTKNRTDQVSNEIFQRETSLGCIHNDRDGVSAADLAEHLGNGEYGSAIRDVADIVSGHQEPVMEANQAPPSDGGAQ